jgi:hypothetical protein
MTDMLTYVQASAHLLGVPLDPARAQRVAQHLERTAAMAQLLADYPLTPDMELTEIYCPYRVVAQ